MSTGISIKSAKYGAGSSTVDVTSAVLGQLKDGDLNFNVSAQSLNVSDPAPGQNKVLTLNYTINNGDINTTTYPDGNPVIINAPPETKTEGLKISQAKYGYVGNWTDVTEAVQAQVSNGAINMKVGFKAVGIPDPNPSKPKELQVQYTLNGGKNASSYKDGDTFKLSAPTTASSSSKGNKINAQTFETAGMSIVWTLTTRFFAFWGAFVLARIGPKFFIGLPWWIWFIIGSVSGAFDFVGLPLLIVGITFFRPSIFGDDFTLMNLKQAMIDGARTTSATKEFGL